MNFPSFVRVTLGCLLRWQLLLSLTGIENDHGRRHVSAENLLQSQPV